MKCLITVKTYPVISKKYKEVVCTAGFKEDGSWIRIYPVPFRQYDEYEKFKKFQWIDADLSRNTSDKRHESHRLTSDITLLDHVGTANDWQERRNFIFRKGRIFTNLSEVVERNKRGELSLATFKPSRIVRVFAKDASREWDQGVLADIEQQKSQGSLFSDEANRFKIARKLPYTFRYEFADDEGKISKLMIEDWEIGALYWNMIDKYRCEKTAVEKVIHKYETRLVDNRDIHFFLGTTLKWDALAPNPFLIIGVFSPPMILQKSLF